MKIVMLCKYPSSRDWGGVATHVKNLTNQFKKCDNGNLVLNILSFGEKEEKINLGKGNVVIIKSHWYYYVFPFLALLRLDKEIKKMKPDIIHVQGTNISPYSLYAVFTRLNYKIIFTLHNFSHLEAIQNIRRNRFPFISNITYQLEKKIFRKSDHMIVVTSNQKKYLIDMFNMESEKVTVIYNGVDVDEFNPSLKKEIIRIKYSINTNDFVLIFAKTFIPNNGPQYLLKAIPLVLEKYSNIKLILVGDGPMNDELVKMATMYNILEKTIFTGAIPHEMIKYYLAASDAVVIPSVAYLELEEGCPNIMLEGMAMGKPVIASRTGGMKEIIDGRGIGILVPDRDHLAIAKAVIQIIEDPRYRLILGDRARNYIVEHMTWDEITKQTVAVYEKLLI